MSCHEGHMAPARALLDRTRYMCWLIEGQSIRKTCRWQLDVAPVSPCAGSAAAPRVNRLSLYSPSFYAQIRRASGAMRNTISIAIFAAAWVLAAHGEEKPSPILTAISSTTITGYVNSPVHWTGRSWPVRFEELCRALQAAGLQVKAFGNHYLFLRSGKAVFYLRRCGPFASRADVLRVRRFLDG